ncbi:MAG TPA: sigma 54-interacting transcriptional regulator [Minicystis sp.]|nr:sigma 54-interacting transcriptional regulator [Minicystis sp.]
MSDSVRPSRRPPPGDYEDASTGVLAQPKRVASAAVRIVVIDGPDRGLEIRPTRGVLRIGTSPVNELRLTDPTVSRLHAELSIGRSRARLRDSGSTNGTFAEGVRIHDAELEAGVTVRVGATSLRVEIGDGEPVMVELSERASFGGLIGRSVEMRRVYAVAERVAATGATVLVQGETGTGKEVLARALHEHSSRAGKPFVSIDCGAIAENLVESELFGHVRGAFSGAHEARAGVFEAAHGGTLFFDEIGEMPIALQKKLLRALETREIRRVGSASVLPVDVRVIAATNRPLAAAVNAGEFREDLYYRLAVVTIELPPLRARRDDVPLLAAHFVERFAGSSTALPRELMTSLVTRSWPGNVRELRNFIERSVSLGFPDAARAPLRAPDLGAAFDGCVDVHLPMKEARTRWTEAFEIAYLRALLRACDGNVTRAAERAGTNRRFLQRAMSRLGLRAGAAEDDERDAD